MSDDDVGVGLAEAIATVRTEFEQAIAAGKESALAFRAGPVEMSFRSASPGPGGRLASRPGSSPSAPRGGHHRHPSPHFTMTPVRRRTTQVVLKDRIADRKDLIAATRRVACGGVAQGSDGARGGRQRGRER